MNEFLVFLHVIQNFPTVIDDTIEAARVKDNPPKNYRNELMHFKKLFNITKYHLRISII